MNIRNKLILMLAIPITALVLLAALGFRTQSAQAEKNEDAQAIADSFVETQQLALDIADERLAHIQLSLAAADPAQQATMPALATELEAQVAVVNDQLASLSASGDPISEPIATNVISILGTARNAETSRSIYNDAILEIDDALNEIPLAGFGADSVLAVQSIRDARDIVNTQENVWVEFFDLAPAEGAEATPITGPQISQITGWFGHVDFVSDAAATTVLSTGDAPMAGPARSNAAAQLSAFQALATEDLYQNTPGQLQPVEVLPFLLENRAEWNQAIESSQNFLLSNIDVSAENIDSSRSLFTLFAVLGSLLLVTLIFVIGRSILGPLGRLMEHAELMTHERLPFAVAKLRSLGASDEIPEIRPIPKESNDEIGSLVDAFNEVQETAVKVATDQARSRRNVAEMFVSLGRRNQQLNHRMINLISDLEQDEQDPETLAGLYQLDHLATRMRRNAESLLVLAGNRSPRQWSRPVPVEDVIRSSLAEVELFERIEVGDLPEISMQGNVVTDVTHLLAELLDNATQFSEPSTSVSISAQETLEGVEIEVFDEGFGINEHDLAELNERITSPPALDEAPSRLLGLFVVGRLSQQHGIHVELQSQPGVGTVATVSIPSSLFAEDVEAAAGRIEAPAALASEPVTEAGDADFLAGLDALAVSPAPASNDAPAIESPAIEAPALESLEIEAPMGEAAALHEEDLAVASIPTMEEVEEALPAFPGVTIDEPTAPAAGTVELAPLEVAPTAAPAEPVVSNDTWPLTKLGEVEPPAEPTTSITQLDAMVERNAAAEATAIPDMAAPETSIPDMAAPETSIPDMAAPTMSDPVVEPVEAAPAAPAAPAPEAELAPVEPFSIAPPVPETDPAPAARQLPAPPILDPVAPPAPAPAAAPVPAHAAEAPAAAAPVAAAPAAEPEPSFGGLPTRAPMAALESKQVAPELIPLDTPETVEESPNKSASAFAAFATGVNRGLNKVSGDPNPQNEGENK